MRMSSNCGGARKFDRRCGRGFSDYSNSGMGMGNFAEILVQKSECLAVKPGSNHFSLHGTVRYVLDVIASSIIRMLICLQLQTSITQTSKVILSKYGNVTRLRTSSSYSILCNDRSSQGLTDGAYIYLVCCQEVHASAKDLQTIDTKSDSVLAAQPLAIVTTSSALFQNLTMEKIERMNRRSGKQDLEA